MIAGLLTLLLAFGYFNRTGHQAHANKLAWDSLPNLEMRGGLKVFWNVGDRADGDHQRQAIAHGFTPVTLVNTFADYPGRNGKTFRNMFGIQAITRGRNQSILSVLSGATST